MWALLVGCVRPESGPEAKMRGLAEAFTAMGWHTRVELVRPQRSAVRDTAALLRRLPRDSGSGVVLLRSHWTLPALVPQLQWSRRQGHAVVIDVPTPVSVGVQEIRQAPRTRRSRAVRLTVETAWTPLSWPAADLIVQYAPDARPWANVAAHRRLTLTNGVDVDSRPLTTSWVKRRGLTFICAGALGPWHGLDRLVRGMAADGQYHSQLVVVGDGPETPRLRSLVDSLGLGHRVSFLGPRGGAALDEVMEQADVGVASLAEHRRGGAALSPLKTRDYIARGLPVLFAGDDPDLRDAPPFTVRLPDDDSAVDVGAVAAWLSRLREQSVAPLTTDALGTGPASIRAFARARLQWRTRAEAIVAALDLPLKSES